MVQATTPTFELTLPASVDLTGITEMLFSLVQGQTRIDKKYSESELSIDGNTILVYLSQEDSLPFVKGQAELQLNWIYPTGKRGCSNITKVNVSNNLYTEVIS